MRSLGPGPCSEHYVGGSHRCHSPWQARSLSLPWPSPLCAQPRAHSFMCHRWALGHFPALSETSNVAVTLPVCVCGGTGLRISCVCIQDRRCRVTGDGSSSHCQKFSKTLVANVTPTKWYEIRPFHLLVSAQYCLPFSLSHFSLPFVLWLEILRPKRWPLPGSQKQRHWHQPGASSAVISSSLLCKRHQLSFHVRSHPIKPYLEIKAGIPPSDSNKCTHN